MPEVKLLLVTRLSVHMERRIRCSWRSPHGRDCLHCTYRAVDKALELNVLGTRLERQLLLDETKDWNGEQ